MEVEAFSTRQDRLNALPLAQLPCRAFRNVYSTKCDREGRLRSLEIANRASEEPSEQLGAR